MQTISLHLAGPSPSPGPQEELESTFNKITGGCKIFVSLLDSYNFNLLGSAAKF